MIPVKSQNEIALMSRAGDVVAAVLETMGRMAFPGLSTDDLDGEAEKLIRKEGCAPAFKGYKGFPGSICASVNDTVVHGIPCRQTLKDGDIISVDVGVMYRGFYADGARTYPVGAISDAARRLVDVTRECLTTGIKEAVAGRRLSNISAAIQSYVEDRGFSVVRALVGHGIGSMIHEDPEIPNYGEPEKGPTLRQGMTLAIEPMVNEGDYRVEVLDDGWSVVTRDRKLSAHFEHTVLITENEPRILTEWQKKKQ